MPRYSTQRSERLLAKRKDGSKTRSTRMRNEPSASSDHLSDDPVPQRPKKRKTGLKRPKRSISTTRQKDSKRASREAEADRASSLPHALIYNPGSSVEREKRSNPTNPPLPPQRVVDGLKAEKTVKISNGRQVRIGGFRDELGNRYFCFSQGKRRAVTPYSDWHGSGTDASNTLRDHGLIMIGELGTVRDAVVRIRRFPLVPVVIKSGWSNYGFALPDGRILVPDTTAEPLAAFRPKSDMLGQAGTLETWIDQVAAPLAAHQLATFFMMIMFAAPLLHFTNRTGNFGFELCGDAGRGKSTLLELIASAAGPAIGSGNDVYWRTLNTTVNALETHMPSHNDLPLLLDEAGLLGGTGKADARADTMRDVVFRLSAGLIKDRLSDAAGPGSRLIYALSTNVSIASLCAAHGAESHAITDRLMSLHLKDRPYGIFDFCPPSYPSTGAFADALKQAASEHHGHALPAFLRYLVNYAHRRPERLRRVIAARVDRFVTHSKANRNDGSEKRVAEAFGLVYAAGRLAVEAGVLPATYKPSRAAIAAYRLHRAHGRPASSFDDRLINVLRHPATIDLTNTRLAKLDDAARSACPAFLYAGKSRQRELVIPVRHIDTVFPGWKGMSSSSDVRKRLKKSSERLTRDRPVGPKGTQISSYVFNVQDLTA